MTKVSLQVAPKRQGKQGSAAEPGAPQQCPIFYTRWVHIPAGLTNFPPFTGLETVVQAGGCETAKSSWLAQHVHKEPVQQQALPTNCHGTLGEKVGNSSLAPKGLNIQLKKASHKNELVQQED